MLKSIDGKGKGAAYIFIDIIGRVCSNNSNFIFGEGIGFYNKVINADGGGVGEFY